MHKRNTASQGFTIVELLIVVVVIAILAAISLVSYTNIQRRAENTKTISAITQYVKLLHSYKALNGTFPTVTGGYACLGTGYVDGICHVNNGSNTGVVNATFNAELKTVASSLPQPSTKVLQLSGTQNATGGSFENNAVTGVSMLRYHLEGAAQECSAGGSGYTYNGNTQCRITFD